MEIEERNALLLSRLSAVLDRAPDLFGPNDMAALTESGFGRAQAMGILLAGALDLYEDREIRDLYLPKMVRELDPGAYRADPYYAAVGLPEEAEDGRWSLRQEVYKPYELFVCGDYRYDGEGRVFPQIGFFTEEFRYPAVLQDGREWMLITPNEIETMRGPAREARGRVVTYGLGLGYFAFMAAKKPDVEQVTVVEKDPAVIRLFERHIRPTLPGAEKIRILEGDAFEHAAALKAADADFVFADIWHDAGDGLPLWQRFRGLEKPGITYRYWIEETMRYYL